MRLLKSLRRFPSFSHNFRYIVYNTVLNPDLKQYRILQKVSIMATDYVRGKLLKQDQCVNYKVARARVAPGQFGSIWLHGVNCGLHHSVSQSLPSWRGEIPYFHTATLIIKAAVRIFSRRLKLHQYLRSVKISHFSSYTYFWWGQGCMVLSVEISTDH